MCFFGIAYWLLDDVLHGELKGYKKFFLEKGKSKTITFDLPYNELGFYNDKLEYIVEKGDFEVYVGTNSQCDLKAEFTL